MSAQKSIEILEWSERIARALSSLKSEQATLGRRARILAAGAVPLAASMAGCGYNPGYRQGGNPHDFSSTTTTGFTYRPESQESVDDPEKKAEYEQRADREMNERRERTEPAAEAAPPAAALPSGGVAPDERATFAQEVRDALAAVDSDVDDIRSRATMAGPETRARADVALAGIAPKRAQLELAKKRLRTVVAADWSKARDETQALMDELRGQIRAARDAL